VVAGGQYAESASRQPQTSPADREALLESARKTYQKALEIDPDCKKAQEALANLYMERAEYDRALVLYDKAVKKYPKDMKLWNSKGLCHCRKKQWGPAVDCFRKSSELDPEDRECLTQLGLCLARAGKTDESVACLTKANGAAQALLAQSDAPPAEAGRAVATVGFQPTSPAAAKDGAMSGN